MSIKTSHDTGGLFPITRIHFTEIQWKETRLQKTFIIVFEYLTLDHCCSRKSSGKEGVANLLPYRRCLLARWVLVLVTTVTLQQGCQSQLFPANLSFPSCQLLSNLSVSKFTSYFWLVLYYVNLKAGFWGLF